jgi:hypothetical protein
MFQNIIDVFTAPSAAFSRLLAKPTVLFPLLVLVGGVLVTNFAYYSWVDQAFMIEELIESQEMNAEQERAMREFAGGDNASTMLTVTTISGALVLLLVQLLHAAYYLVVALFAGHQISYRHWLSLVCWTGLPRVLAYLASIIAIFMAPDGKVSPYELNPLALNSLLRVNVENNGLQQLLSNVDVTLFWGLALLVIAFSQWTQRSILTSTVIALAPFALVFGVWAYFVI